MRTTPIIIAVVLGLVLFLYSIWMVNWPHPLSHQINYVPLVTQPDGITCGPTSVLMVLRSYGIEVTLDEVKKQTRTEWFIYDGKPVGMTSPEYIAKAMTHFGIDSRMVAGNVDKLKYFVSNDKPTIVLLRSGKMLWHYVVVTGYDEEKITIADPSGGVKREMSLEHFVSAWSFQSDMGGRPVVSDCVVCNGVGRWAWVNLGPIGICEICNGTGKQPDFIGIFIRSLDVRPMTMIVPKY